MISKRFYSPLPPQRAMSVFGKVQDSRLGKHARKQNGRIYKPIGQPLYIMRPNFVLKIRVRSINGLQYCKDLLSIHEGLFRRELHDDPCVQVQRAIVRDVLNGFLGDVQGDIDQMSEDQTDQSDRGYKVRW